MSGPSGAAEALEAPWSPGAPGDAPGPVPGLLVCADGSVFEGELQGALASVTGELVFNTVMSGYQEVVTDPSYAGQVVAFTYPHIGNYGVTPADAEAARPHCRAVVVRQLTSRPSSWRASGDLPGYLARWGVPVLGEVDTRRLTRHVRQAGALPCAIGPLEGPGATTEAVLAEAARAEPGTTGADLVSTVTTDSPYHLGEGALSVVVYDFGVKASALAELAKRARVEVVPARTPVSEVLARRPDGVLLSNGPGDPAALPWAVEAVGGLLSRVPVLGICLGHQLLARALGASTYKLPFGHHGGNHPVRRVEDGSVEITSQNHSYAVSADSLGEARLTHLNLNDGVVEGFCRPDLRVMAVQFHPEAGPGPHDARHVFDGFAAMMAGA